MKIAINGYEAAVPRFGYDEITGLPNRVGSSAYVFETLINLHKIDRNNDYVIYLPVTPTKDMPEESERWKYKVLPARKLWTLTALSREFAISKPFYDVFWNPGHYLPPFAPKNSIVSILDLSYVYFPELFTKGDLLKLNKWSKYSVNKAKKILTISQSSKNDIIKEYKVSSEKVSVVYPGIMNLGSKNSLNMENLSKKYEITGPYILFVGTLQPRKNVARLIEAFSKLDSETSLVIVGKKGWQFEEILAAPAKFGVESRVKFLHNVTSEDLPSFYRNAELFVLPSLYEGFGLPVLEAMQLDCPVITSDISSLPEAGGDAALYFDPKNVDDIRDKMQKVLNDKDLRKKMIEKGKDQVKKFSWEKSAKETLNVIESL